MWDYERKTTKTTTKPPLRHSLKEVDFFRNFVVRAPDADRINALSTYTREGGGQMGKEAGTHAAGGRQVPIQKLHFLPETMRNGRKNTPPKSQNRTRTSHQDRDAGSYAGGGRWGADRRGKSTQQVGRQVPGTKLQFIPETPKNGRKNTPQ